MKTIEELIALERLSKSPFHLSIGQEQNVTQSESTKIGNPSGPQGIETIIGIGLSDGFDFRESIK